MYLLIPSIMIQYVSVFSISSLHTLSAIERNTEGFKLDLEEINDHVRQED
jgi:hypothetical protein